MVHKLLAATLIFALCEVPLVFAQEKETKPGATLPNEVLQEILTTTLKEEGDWGLIQQNSKEAKMDIWVYMTEARVKLHSLTLDIHPAAAVPDSTMHDFSEKEHADYFKDGQKFPKKGDLKLFTIVQRHIIAVASDGAVVTRQYCTHTKAFLFNMKNGKLVAKHTTNTVEVTVELLNKPKKIPQENKC